MQTFFIKAGLYILCFALSFYGCSSLQYSRWIKANHVVQAQILYVMLACGIAYLAAQFILGFLYWA